MKKLILTTFISAISFGAIACEPLIVITGSWCYSDKTIKTITLYPEATDGESISIPVALLGLIDRYSVRSTKETNFIYPDVALPPRGKESKDALIKFENVDSSLWSIDVNKSKSVQKLVF